MTIKDVIDIPKGEEREIFFMDRNIIDIADRNEKNVEMLPSDFFKDCYFIKFIKTDDGIRGTWFWNKHYLDDVGNCPEHKEFDIDLGTFWYPLKDNKVLKQQNMTPLICYQILKKIKDEVVNFLGFSHTYSRPEWMIITSLAVPPPSVRPSVRQSDNQRSEDDLTYALTNIVKSDHYQ
jgi:DNA-directed RNA polymerase beta' subunit